VAVGWRVLEGGLVGGKERTGVNRDLEGGHHVVCPVSSGRRGGSVVLSLSRLGGYPAPSLC
jgi:hypothetical protein